MLLMGPAEGFTLGGIPKVAFGPEKGGVPPAPVAVTPLPAALMGVELGCREAKRAGRLYGQPALFRVAAGDPVTLPPPGVVTVDVPDSAP